MAENPQFHLLPFVTPHQRLWLAAGAIEIFAYMERRPSASNPLSINRRMASEREGLGSGWRSIQAVIAASSSSDQRTVLTGSLPVAGRPRRLFCISAIDPPLD